MPSTTSLLNIFRPRAGVSLELSLFNTAGFVLAVFSLSLLILEAFGAAHWAFLLGFFGQVAGFKVFAFTTRSEKRLTRTLLWFCIFSIASVLLVWTWGHLRSYEMNYFYALLLIINLLLVRASKSHWILIAFLGAFIAFKILWMGATPHAQPHEAWAEGIFLLIFSLGAWAVVYFVKFNYEQQKQRADQQYQRLQKTSANLKTRNQHLEGLSQMISHNLRSPISGLKMMVKMHPKVKPAEQEEIVEEVEKGLGDLHQMVEDTVDILLDYRELNQPSEKVSLHQVYTKVHDQLRGMISNKQAEIETDFEKAPSLHIPEVYLNSIFHNLISNALKYHQPGEKPRLWISSSKEGNRVILKFEDAGMGIDLQEHGHQLFKMNSSLENSNKESSRGMGLFITKNQVEMQGGQIWVESEPGKGTTFFVALESL